MEDVADIQVINENMDKLDQWSTGVDEKTKAATSAIPGIVKYGTEASTALEGSKLAEILGIEYGGVLNNTNAKVAGKGYYDTANKKIYKCTANTSINYADAGYFIEVSNNDLLGKLQNLCIGETKVLARIPINSATVTLGQVLRATAIEDVYNYNFLSFVISESLNGSGYDANFLGIKTPEQALTFSGINDAITELGYTRTKLAYLTGVTNRGQVLECNIYDFINPGGSSDTNNELLMIGTQKRI
ncbi:MAG: hypothetical protein ACRC1R_00505 [Cetobacterium sp.]